MSELLASTLGHLRELVAFDTRNPPRAIGSGGIFDYLRAQLPGFNCTVVDHGAGAVSMLAQRGVSEILFNVHLDTVPDSPHWSASPFQLRVTDAHAIGLGACDIKGAAAALLTAASKSVAPCAILFTSDEEANDPRCVAAFLHDAPATGGLSSDVTGDHACTTTIGVAAEQFAGEGSNTPVTRYRAVIVAEPTRCEAVIAHRGISSVRMNFKGRAGHASGVAAKNDNALHQALYWGSRALNFVETQAHQRFGGMTGLRFNVGRIEGGIKANVIAPDAEVRFGFRPLPSMDTDQILAKFKACASPDLDNFVETFRGPALPAGDVAHAEYRRLAARDLADELGLALGNAVDFWTEAALFSAADYTTIVCGPGDIAQAHSADEFVELSQLLRITECYLSILQSPLRKAAA